MARKNVTLGLAKKHEERLAWVFILPVLLGLLIFQAYPIFFSLYISFTNWNLISTPQWIGLKNFIDLFTTDRFFLQTLGNTTKYALGTVVPGLFIAMAFSVLLNNKRAGQSVYRAIYFIPVVVPTVSIALLWAWIYEPNFGILNGILKMAGAEPVPWLSSTRWAMPSLIVQAIWASLGFNIVIFLAGLQSISTEYYEAAEIDGANGIQKFLSITLPLLSPVTFFVFVTSVIGSFQVFDIPYIMTQGGPANSTQSIVMYLYNNAFRFQRMGLASSVGYMVFIIIMVLTFINFRLRRIWVFEEN